jgi:hypothetical protein
VSPGRYISGNWLCRKTTLVEGIVEAVLFAWASGTERERATNDLRAEKDKEAEIGRLQDELNAAREENFELARKTTRLEDDLTHAQNRIDGLTQVVRAYEQIGADGVNPQWVQTLPLAGNAVGHHGGVYGHGQGTYGGDQGRLTGAGWADDMYRSLPRDRSESPTQSVLDWDARSDDSIVS